VAMISGTFILTDTINKGFTTIFTESYKNTSAVITAHSAISNSNSGAALTGGFAASVLDKVQRLPDVAAAAGSITDTAKLVDRNGHTFTTHGAPALAFSVDPNDQRFNPLTLVAGHFPTTSSEVAIDKAAADKAHFKVGDTIRGIARGPEKSFSLAGIVKFGSVSSIGSATIAVFDLNTAQQLFNKQGKFDVVRVAAKGNTPSSKLAAQIRPLLPSTAQVRTVSAQVKQETKNVGFVGIIQKILLGFGRAVGLDKLMSSIGIDLPKSATVFATRTIVVSLVVGTLITLLSAIRPAIRATRVPPIAAVREGAELPPGRLAFLGPPFKALVAAAGIGLLLYGFFVHGIGVTQRLLAMG